MRFSKQREIINNVVHSTNLHPTADWVYEKAKKSLPNLSLGTVYRNLKQLNEQGSIRVIYDGSLARYDWNVDPHDHMKCKECGRMIDIELSNEQLKNVVKRKYNFEVSDVEITLIGNCNNHG